MKKNHRREIILARIVLTVILVVVAAIIAVLVMFVSTRIKTDTAANKPAETESEAETQSEPAIIQPTEQVVVPETQAEVVMDEADYRNTTTKVNFRKSPSTDADIIATLAEGAKVEWLSDEDDGWAKIRYDEKEGYVKAEFLKKAETSSEKE